MNKQLRRSGRNQAIECCRLVASIAVVFIHFQFPGQLGSLANCLARIAVPFFFVVSGYFAWGIGLEKIRRRMWDTLKLVAMAILLALSWDVVTDVILPGAPFLPWFHSRINVQGLAAWLVVNWDRFGGGHLWYLSSVLTCYLVLYVYTRWNGEGTGYGTLYLLCSILLAFQIVLDSFAVASTMMISHFMHRNALLMGLPLFTLGIFLREHQIRLRETFSLTNRKLAALFVLGAVLSMLQWSAFGVVEMPMGTLLEVFALMLLLVTMPPFAKENSVLSRMIAHFGNLSTFVYITHLIWGDIYIRYGSELVTARLGMAEPYIQPIITVLISLIMGTVWELVKTLVSSTFRKPAGA